MPPLLVKTEFTHSSYAVHLTDLSRVWTEKLDGRAIGARAQRQGTVIRAADDASQLLLLLETLEAAFYSDGGGADEADLALTSSGSNDDDDDNDGRELRLKLTCKLPGPLPELQWTFTLQQGSAIDFTNEFVLPLVAAVDLAREKVKSLQDTIQDKDRVIETLRDSLEDFGVKAESLVGVRRRKALAAFDGERFDRRYSGLQEEKSGGEVVREVFGPQAGTATATATTTTRPVGRFAAETTGWWRGIQDDSQVTSQGTVEAGGEGKGLPEVKKKEEGGVGVGVGVDVGSETEDEDDFEVSAVAPSRFRGLPWAGHKNPSTPLTTTVAGGGWCQDGGSNSWWSGRGDRRRG